MSDSRNGPNVLASALLEALFLTMRRVRREATQGAGLGYADLMILGSLRKSPGRGVSDLAAEAGVSGPTMSGQIKRLEESGHILRQPGPDGDRRRVSLRLSPRAETMIDALKRESADWLAERLGDLTPEQRQALSQAVPALLLIAGAGGGRDGCIYGASEKFQ
jgi:DNA-binding MarR family transcriptional regulator